MKTLASILWIAAALVAISGSLHSQAPAAPAAPMTPLQALQQMKAQNAALLQKQTATLQELDALAKEAAQVKVLTKRS